MSAEILCRAASLMRERAEAAHAGPWEDRSHRDYGWVALYNDEDAIAEESLPSMEPGGSATPADAAHIASWHPTVALAVADWLDTAGADIWAHGPLCECTTGCDACDDNLWEPHARDALDVARAYLGEAS